MKSTAVVVLKLSEEEFWELTPKEYNAYVELYSTLEDRKDYRAGMICAAVMNPHRKKGTRPFTPYTFFPKRSSSYKPSSERQTWQQQLAMVKALHAAFTGEKR